MSLTWIGSPNYTKGRDGNRITKIVCHWMAGTLASTDAVFQDTNRQTSAHYGIEDETVHQYVSEADTAYHAGRWAANLTSIGIEHSAQPGRDASEATYQTSAELIAEVCKRYGLPINANTIVPHRSIVATQCPGTVDLAKLISLAQAINQGDVNVDYKAEYELLKRERDTVTYPRIELLQNERDTVTYPTIERQKAQIAELSKEVESLKRQLGNPAEIGPGLYIVKPH